MSKSQSDGDINKVEENGNVTVFTPRDLSFVWGDDERYWSITGDKPAFAELMQVCWLEVTGSTKSTDTGLDARKYEISFTISFDEAFGWKDSPVFLMAKIGKEGKYKWQKILNLPALVTKPETQIPSSPFTIDVDTTTSDDRVLYFGLYEVWTGKWKGGLKIHNAKVKKLTS